MNFGLHHTIDPVTISPSGSNTAGELYSLNCSATLFDPVPLPSDVHSPTFEWFFGPNGSALLPSGLTPPATAVSSSNSTSKTYTSILQFSSLSQCHAGKYTCRLGAGSLVKSAVHGYHEWYNIFENFEAIIVVTVIVLLSCLSSATTISVQITVKGAPILGQTDYSLSCCVSGADVNHRIVYQWSKNNGSLMQQSGTDPRLLSFFPLQLSSAGNYTFNATVESNQHYTRIHPVIIQSEFRDKIIIILW